LYSAPERLTPRQRRPGVVASAVSVAVEEAGVALLWVGLGSPPPPPPPQALIQVLRAHSARVERSREGRWRETARTAGTAWNMEKFSERGLLGFSEVS
jgi:hypothetical protein